MKNKIAFLAIILCTVTAFTACTNIGAAVKTSANVQSGTAGIKQTETEPAESRIQKAPELYPAYVIDGTEKMWGYINDEGKFIIRPKYQNAADFRNNDTAWVSERDKWGMIDQSGNFIIPPQYSWSPTFYGNNMIVTDDSGSYLLDEKGRVLFHTEGGIDGFACGLSAFSKPAGHDKSLWGYINEEGKIVIEPKYEEAQAFSKDKALVQIGDGHFGLIDKKGEILKEINQAGRIFNLSGDTFVFTKSNGDQGNRCGYMTTDGKVLLDAVYADAQAFEDGLAIVNASKDYGNEYGVVDQNGKFVIPARYAQITSLKKGIYAVPKAQDYTFNTTYMKKALFDKTGKQLTGFSYYDLERLDNGLISATDDTSTFLLDEKGNVVNSIPKAEGIGSIKPCERLYKVEMDGGLYYLSQDGRKIWTADDTIRLDGGLQVRMKTFRPDRCMLIQYPEISGLSDSKVQQKINALLKEKLIGDNKASKKEGEIYTESVDINCDVAKNKDLLIVTQDGYIYPIGAAHGQPTREDYHINLRNGNLYTLKDLFKDSGYSKKLAALIRKKITRINNELGGEQSYSTDIGKWEESSGFRLDKNSLRIYFYPYAIACYAAGFPEFTINYDELKDLINMNGDFWNSFDRDSFPEPDGSANEVASSEKKKIEEALNNYEKEMIEAINKNNFKLVEPWLYLGSSLYTSQKKLVADLSRKQIKERLDGYSIKEISTDNFGIMRASVTENIGIQYPGKDYTIRQYNWVYSLRYDYDNKRYELTYIDVWDKNR